MIQAFKRTPRSYPFGFAFALLASAAAAQEAPAPAAMIPLTELISEHAAGGAETVAEGADPVEALSLETIGVGPAEAAGIETIPLFGSSADAAGEGAEGPAEPALEVAPVWPRDISRVAEGRVQFRGERETLDFTLVVPPSAQPEALAIVAVSSAFVDPSRSRLLVFAEDELVGEVPLESITTPEEVRLPVRAGLLRPGHNNIRIEAQLVHRLYCGATASYDLWANVDLASSGALHARVPERPSAAAFLAAASRARSSGHPITVTGDLGRADPAQITAFATQLGSAIGGGLSFEASRDVGSSADRPAPGIEVRRAGAPRAEYRLGADGRLIMELTIGGGKLPRLFREETAFGDMPPPPVLLPDEPTSLAELGFETARILANRWTGSVQFRLPDDWLLNMRSRATLHFAYGHLPNLPEGSVLRVRVNDATVRIVPLEGARPLAAEPLEVRFDVGHLRSGRNVLGFEVELPGDPENQPCLDQKIHRVEIGAESTILVPGSARMHLPGIARWMSPGGGSLLVGNGSRNDEGWPFAMRVASALRSLPGSPEAGFERRLVVLRAADLDEGIFGNAALDPQAVLAALQVPRKSGGFGAAEAATDAPEEDQGVLSASAEGLATLAAGAWGELTALVLPDAATEFGTWLADQQGQAMLVQLDAAAPEDVHLVLAEDANLDEVAGALEAVAKRGTPLSGHAAILDRDSLWHAWTDRTRLPVLEEGVSEANWRVVVGNYASARPAWFAGMILTITLVSVFLANSYLTASRRQG